MRWFDSCFSLHDEEHFNTVRIDWGSDKERGVMVFNGLFGKNNDK